MKRLIRALCDLKRIAAISFIIYVFTISAFSQQAAQPFSIPTTGFTGLDQYRASRIAIFTDDFGQLNRYRVANAALKPAGPGENRVVFFGDSITDLWHLDEYFPGKSYINRGIGGQTTPQMLVRFRHDVIDLHPKVVVFLAGTNDTPQLQDMYAQRSSAKILELNGWLKSYVGAHSGCLYLDYFSAMVDDKGLLKRDLAEDGLHPNAAGYKIMAPLAERAIQQALGPPKSSNP